MESLEVQKAFLENIKSDRMIDEYRAGRTVESVAKERHLSAPVLRQYFTDRYGSDWRKRTPAPSSVDLTGVRGAV